MLARFAILNRSRAYFLGASRTSLAYRSNFWLQVVGILVLVGIQAWLWRAITIAQPAAIDSGAATSVVVYVTVSRLVGFVLPGQAVIDLIATQVRSGAIIVELARPVPPMAMALANALGRSVVRLVFQVVPAGLLSALLFQIDLLASEHFVIFLASFTVAYLMSFLISYLIGMTTLWTGNVWGVAELYGALTIVLGGSLIPLSLYPEGLRAVATYLPFQGIYYVPVALFAGLPVRTIDLVVQACWASVLLVTGVLATRVLVSRAVLHGG